MQLGTQALKINPLKREMWSMLLVQSKGQCLVLDAVGLQLNLFKWKIISNDPSHSPNNKTNKFWLSISYFLGKNLLKTECVVLMIHRLIVNYETS